jgi:hypothetical protein
MSPAATIDTRTPGRGEGTGPRRGDDTGALWVPGAGLAVEAPRTSCRIAAVAAGEGDGVGAGAGRDVGVGIGRDVAISAGVGAEVAARTETCGDGLRVGLGGGVELEQADAKVAILAARRPARALAVVVKSSLRTGG